MMVVNGALYESRVIRPEPYWSMSIRRMGSGCQSNLPQMTGAGLAGTDPALRNSRLPIQGSTLRCSASALEEGFLRASEKDRLAVEVADRRVDFEMALSDKRKYPVQQFREFWEIGRRYAELTKRAIQ